MTTSGARKPAPGGAGVTWPPRARWAAAAALAIGTALLYARIRSHAFLLWDDNQYVTANAVVLRGLTWAGVRWAFTTFAVSNWHPLTWLSHMLDVELFGVAAGAHHLVSAVLHAANTALLFLVLARMTGAPGRSAVVAALFAVHPLHVESVAWLSERKDLFSTLFGLLALAAYASYAVRPRAGAYALVVAAFAASLLSKAMWVTFPLLLLLLDVWPLQRVRAWPGVRDPRPPRCPPRSTGALLLEKAPLLALSAAASAVTVVAQSRGGAVMSLGELGFGARLANALVSYARYVAKTVWPTELAAHYPLPAGGYAWWQIAAAAALVAAFTALAIGRGLRAPWLAVGWCWFLGTLVPVIGLVQVGHQALADRYAYVPIVGLFIAAAWELAERIAALGPHAVRTGTAAAAAASIALAAAAWRQLGTWSDQETLFRHALAVTTDNGRAHLLLAQALAEEDRYPEAVAHAREAVRLEPGNARAHKNLGFMLYRMGLLDEAIAALEEAVRIDPGYSEAHGNLGIAYGRKGLAAEAMRELAAESRLQAAARAP
jgi:tetratricopeptide (TPR) repeat protein